MSDAALAALVGDAAPALRLRSMGHGGAGLTPGRLPRSVSRETTLGRDERDGDRLETILALLTARVAAQLRDEGLVARVVVVKLRDERFGTVTRRRTLGAPTQLDAELREPALALFRPAFAELRRRNLGARLVGIAATGIVEAAEADLFEPPERTRRRQLTDAVDEVRRRYGFDAVKEARLVPKPR